MIVARHLEAFPADAGPTCLALGVFDGVHLGHRALIEALRGNAQALDALATIVTFDPHPLTVIAPPREPFLLSTIEERLELLGASGVDAVVVANFDAGVRSMGAGAWLNLLVRSLRPRAILASSTHAFGRDREGTAEFLQTWTQNRGIRATIVPVVRNGDVIISSSIIRERLRRGDVRGAATSLGRWYALRGEVVRGDGRGRQIGVPTANVRPSAEKLIPAHGVYAAYASVDGRTYASAANIGTRPTFGGDGVFVEAHLLDADLDLYGKVLELAFVSRLRGERRFSGVDELREQIAKDIEMARSELSDLQYFSEET
jgi:riboflavin kinase/FMN adenylyltransferase